MRDPEKTDEVSVEYWMGPQYYFHRCNFLFHIYGELSSLNCDFRARVHLNCPRVFIIGLVRKRCYTVYVAHWTSIHC